MTEKDLAQEFEEQIPEDEDIDFGDELDPIEEKEPEPEPEPVKVAEPVEDVRIKKLEADLQAAKEEAAQAAKEREEAWQEADKARDAAIQGAISQWQNDLTREQREIVVLQQQYARAQTEGDADKQSDLIAKYNEKQQALNQLNNNINNAQQQLANKPVRKVAEVKVDAKPERTNAEKMADSWVGENSWYHDPAYMDKKVKADEIVRKQIAAGYDASRLSFWSNLNKELEGDDSKKTQRRAAPAVRPVGNNNNVGNRVTNSKKADAKVLEETNKFLEMRGVSAQSIGQKKFEEMRKRAYISIRNQLKNEASNG